MSLIQPGTQPERFDPFAELYRASFQTALAYEPYLATANAVQLTRWRAAHDAAVLTPEQHAVLAGFSRRMPVLAMSGIWCGDCIREGALLQRIAEAAPAIELRFLDRDAAPESFRDGLRTLGALRLPATLVLSEDFWFVDRLGDRSLATYRRMARTQLGDSCPTGIGAPAADELAASMHDVVERLERAHLLLRISPILRTRHGD